MHRSSRNRARFLGASGFSIERRQGAFAERRRHGGEQDDDTPALAAGQLCDEAAKFDLAVTDGQGEGGCRRGREVEELASAISRIDRSGQVTPLYEVRQNRRGRAARDAQAPAQVQGPYLEAESVHPQQELDCPDFIGPKVKALAEPGLIEGLCVLQVVERFYDGVGTRNGDGVGQDGPRNRKIW